VSALTGAAPTSASEGARVVLLGTVAGPVIHPTRAMSAQAVVVGADVYLFDCGYGAVARLAAAGLPLAAIRAIFFTHHHSDHNADYPNILHLAWVQGLKRRVPVYGPPPMRRIHDAALAFHAEDIDIRVRATGRTPPTDAFDVHEISEAGDIYTDENVRVTGALVDHPPFRHAFAFRIEAGGRRIVLSGDTAPCEALAELAQGADLLVHEAMLERAIDAMLATRPYVPPGLRDFLVGGHTSAQDCGRIAQRCGVKALALTHLLPSDDGLVSEEEWRQEAARHFSGRIEIGRDLMVL